VSSARLTPRPIDSFGEPSSGQRRTRLPQRSVPSPGCALPRRGAPHAPPAAPWAQSAPPRRDGQPSGRGGSIPARGKGGAQGLARSQERRHAQSISRFTSPYLVPENSVPERAIPLLFAGTVSVNLAHAVGAISSAAAPAAPVPRMASVSEGGATSIAHLPASPRVSSLAGHGGSLSCGALVEPS